MKIKRQLFKAGGTILIKERASWERKKGEKRAPRENYTTDDVWNINLKNSIFELALILNENFVPGDHHIALTFEKEKEPDTEEGFKKAKEKFLRKFRDEIKRRGIDAKYVIVPHRTKEGKKRFHYHFICSRVPKEIIEKCWPHGYIFYSEMWKNPNRMALAKYLIKGAAHGLREEGLINVRKFTKSRNVIVPEGETIELEQNLEADVKPFKGYYIDGEVERYENKITRTPCREYVLVSDGTRDKRINKKKMKPMEKINYIKAMREAYTEEQMSLLDLF